MVSVCEKRRIVATESRCSGLRVGLARRVSLHWQARARARALFKFAQAPWARSETLSNHVLLNNAVTSSDKLYEGTYGILYRRFNPRVKMDSRRQPPKTIDELQRSRETRANDALAMKEQQLRMLNDQNVQLLRNLDRVEEDANAIQLEKVAAESDNRTLRDENFRLLSRSRTADAQLSSMKTEAAEKDKQLRVITDQNSELLRLLETEEAQSAKLSAENQHYGSELDLLKTKYGTLLATAKTHEEMANRAAHEGQLRADEVRILRSEIDQLKTLNQELKLKAQVELEALHEQLRVRKEKQYQLLEKLQAQDRVKRLAEDQVSSMEEKLRQLHAKSVELDTHLQVETRNRRMKEESNRNLTADLNNLMEEVKEVRNRSNLADSERLRIEAEARDSGDQLREMAEKVFQLLERLKLAELSKTRAMEELNKREAEAVALSKKNARLLKEATREGRGRVKAELDKKILQDQLRAVRKHNSVLASRCREEVRLKLEEREEKGVAVEKVKTFSGRLGFLLNKMQTDEEAKVVRTEEMRKLEAQLKTSNDHLSKLQAKLDDANESNRIISQASRIKQEELDTTKARFDALLDSRQTENVQSSTAKIHGNDSGQNPHVSPAEANGRFLLDTSTSSDLILLRGKKASWSTWLEAHDANKILKRAQNSPNTRELLIQHIGRCYGMLMAQEEGRDTLYRDLQDCEQQIEHVARKCAHVQEKLHLEEEAKRRTLLRYVHSVKNASIPSIVRSVEKSDEVGVIQLPESSISDEELHAISALLRGDMSIQQLILRDNMISDDGVHALASVLAGKSNISTIDLRGNRMTPHGIRILAEALERSERVRHVYVHAAGKVEALGIAKWTPVNPPDGATTAEFSASVETVCCVDCRDNIQHDQEQQKITNSLKKSEVPVAVANRKRSAREKKIQRMSAGKATRGPMANSSRVGVFPNLGEGLTGHQRRK